MGQLCYQLRTERAREDTRASAVCWICGIWTAHPVNVYRHPESLQPWRRFCSWAHWCDWQEWERGPALRTLVTAKPIMIG